MASPKPYTLGDFALWALIALSLAAISYSVVFVIAQRDTLW